MTKKTLRMNVLISLWESYHHRLDSNVPEPLQDENISPHTFLTDNTLHRLHIDMLHMDLSPKLLHSQKFPHCLLCNLDYRAKININEQFNDTEATFSFIILNTITIFHIGSKRAKYVKKNTSTYGTALIFNDTHPTTIMGHIFTFDCCTKNKAFTAGARCAVVQSPRFAVRVFNVLVKTWFGCFWKYQKNWNKITYMRENITRLVCCFSMFKKAFGYNCHVSFFKSIDSKSGWIHAKMTENTSIWHISVKQKLWKIPV